MSQITIWMFIRNIRTLFLYRILFLFLYGSYSIFYVLSCFVAIEIRTITIYHQLNTWITFKLKYSLLRKVKANMWHFIKKAYLINIKINCNILIFLITSSMVHFHTNSGQRNQRKKSCQKGREEIQPTLPKQTQKFQSRQ